MLAPFRLQRKFSIEAYIARVKRTVAAAGGRWPGEGGGGGPAASGAALPDVALGHAKKGGAGSKGKGTAPSKKK